MHGGYHISKVFHFPLLGELSSQAMSVSPSDKLCWQDYIRFSDFIWTTTLWNTKKWIAEASRTTLVAQPCDLLGTISHRALPSPHLYPFPLSFPFPVVTTVLSKDQLQLCNTLAKISGTLEPIYAIWKLVSNQTWFPKGVPCSFTVRIFFFLKCTHLIDLK